MCLKESTDTHGQQDVLQGHLQPCPVLAPGPRTWMTYLDDGVAELQGVHELDERGEQQPVVLQQAVPLLALLLQLRGQRRVEPAEPGCKDLCWEIQRSTCPALLGRKVSGTSQPAGAARGAGDTCRDEGSLDSAHHTPPGIRGRGRPMKGGRTPEVSQAEAVTSSMRKAPAAPLKGMTNRHVATVWMAPRSDLHKLE